MLDVHARRQSLDRRLENVLTSLDLVRDHEEALSKSAKELLEQLERLVLFARTALEHRWQVTEAFPEPGRKLTRQITCDDFQTLLIELSQTLLPALEGSESSRIPVEIQPLVKRLVDEAGGADLDVVLFSDDNFNYSIQKYPEPVVYLAPKIAPREPAPKPADRNFLFLRLPRLERDSAALHTVIVGHELGHLRDWNSNISGGLAPEYPSAWLDESGQIKPECVRKQELFLEIIENWSSELTADIFGALLFGPASLTSLTEIVLSLSPLSHESLTHPGTHRRATVILKVLSDLGFESVQELNSLLATYEAECQPNFDAPIDIRGIDTDEDQVASQAAWDWLSQQIDYLIAQCKKSLSQSTPMSASDWDDVEWAANMLMMGQPAGEHVIGPLPTDEGAEFRSNPVSADIILNAAWLVRQRQLWFLAKRSKSVAGKTWRRWGARRCIGRAGSQVT